MERKKRYEVPVEELVAKLVGTWNKATTLSEVKRRASLGLSAFCDVKHKSYTNANNYNQQDSNHLWRVFQKYPEVFLFPELCNEIKHTYESQHVSMSSNKYTQSDNFERTLSKFREVAKHLYGEFYDMINNSNSQNSHSEARQTKGKSNQTTNKSDNSQELKGGKMERANYNFKLTAEMRKPFINDQTSIEVLRTDDNGAVIDYLFRCKDCKTIADLMELKSDKKANNNLSSFGVHNPTPYKSFVDALNRYVLQKIEQRHSSVATGIQVSSESESQHKKVSFANIFDDDDIDVESEEWQQPSQIASTQTTQPTSAQPVEISIGELDDLKALSPEMFVKGSIQMDEISKAVNAYLNKQIDEFKTAGFTSTEIDAEMDNLLSKFHAIVDEKRARYVDEKNISLIRKKVAEGVKYKHNLKETKQKSLLGDVRMRNKTDDFSVDI